MAAMTAPITKDFVLLLMLIPPSCVFDLFVIANAGRGEIADHIYVFNDYSARMSQTCRIFRAQFTVS